MNIGVDVKGTSEKGDFARSHSETRWTQQRMKNLDVILDVVRIFIVPENPNTPTNQTVMHNSRLLAVIIQLALSVDTPPFVQTACFLAAADLINENEQLQSYVNASTVHIPSLAVSHPLVHELLSHILDNSSTNFKTYEF